MLTVKPLEKNKSFFFFFITFFCLALVSIIFYVFAIRFTESSSFLFRNFYFFIPALAVFVTKKIIYKERFWQPDYYRFQFNANFLWVVYFLFGLELMVFFVDILMPIIHFSNDQGLLLEKYATRFSSKQFAVLTTFVINFNIQFFWILNLFVGVIVGMTSGLFFFYFQEIGWRGFLLERYRLMGFWKSSLMVGFWCGLFYLPLLALGYSEFNHFFLEVCLIMAWNILISPILVLIRNMSKSVIYPALFLGVLNATYMLSSFFVVGAEDYLISFKVI